MLRLVDLSAALQAAAEPSGDLTGTLRLVVDDPVCPWVRSLAQVVSGYIPARTAHLTGRLKASRPEAVAFLEALYGSRPSHLADFF
jgi:hypothetical protein